LSWPFETRSLETTFMWVSFSLFSFLVFHFSVKNWNYCHASIKETGRDPEHIILWILWLGLTKWDFRGETLPSKPEVWRAFWPLRCFETRVHLQPSVSHLGHGRAQPCKTSNEVTLQNFRSPVKKWKVDHKNEMHSKSKQLLFNVA